MINFKEEVEKRKDQLIQDIETLCAIPSVYDEKTAGENQPYGKACRNALDAMLEIGKRDGFVTYDEHGYAGHIDIGDQEESFGILGHLDVVPVNEVGWNSDPFKVVQVNDKLYGRGVADYFQNNPFPSMGFTPDAEFPVVYGEKGIVRFDIKGDVKKDGLVAMVAGDRVNIVPEKCEAIIEGNHKQYEASFKEFLEKNHVTGVIEEEGNCTKLILKGKSAHASLPEEGINAVSLLATYLDGIINNKLVHFIATYLNDYDGKGLQINHEGLMGKLTMNLGVVRYVKEKAEIELDLRCPHEIDLKKMADDVEELCHSYGLTLESDIHEPLYVDPNSELIQKLHKAYVEVSGDTTSAPQAIGGGTYAKSMPNCVAFGCEFKGEDNAIHGNNENIKVDSLLKSTEIFAKAIYDLIKE